VSTETVAPRRGEPFDPDVPWRLHDSVQVRPERFGALLYHFGTRRLSFLKSVELLAVLQKLASSPTARDALDAAGIAPSELASYERALATLAASQMIERCVRP
jgi:putative mycofactocin binding protein MftB